MAIIFIEYLYWHFAVAPSDLIHMMINYVKGTWRRFLIVRHLRTLFSPWHRRQPSDLAVVTQTNIGTKIVDLISDSYIRLLAAFVRLLVILFGLLSELIVILFFIFLIVFWLFWPFLSIYLFIKGVSLLII